MKGLIYARQSSGDEQISESVELQIEKCQAVAKADGIQIVGVFTDLNVSGKTYPTGGEAVAAMDFAFNTWYDSQTSKKKFRDGLGTALKLIDDVDFLFVYDITRLYRPVTGSFLEAYIHQMLISHNVKVRTLSGVIDLSTFNDSLIMALQNRVNNEQLRTQIEKSKAALKKLKDSGEYHPGLCRMIGYRSSGIKHQVIIDEEGSEIVKTVFRLFNDEAMTINGITKFVNVKFRSFFRNPCCRSIIRKILLSPLYCGYMKNSEGELVKAKQLDGKELITLDAWMKANRKIDLQRVAMPKTKKNWLPLTTLTYCGQCGMKMVTQGGMHNRRLYYMCQRHLRDGNHEACRNNLTISHDCAEGNGLIELIKPLLLAEAIKQMKTAKNDSEERKKLSEIEVRLNESKRKAAKLTEMWMASLMDETVYEHAMKELKAKEAELMKEKTMIEATLSRDTTQFDWVKLMMKFKSDALTRGEYEQLAYAMIKKILIFREWIEVRTIYGDVTIPRQHVGKYRLGCNFHLLMKHGKAAIYFYRGRKRMIAKDILDTFEKTAVLNDVEIFEER